MTQIIDFAKKNIIKAAKICYDSPANFWQKAAIATISVYHLCQVIIIGLNKDTPKKEKAFLIPQEIMDGIINLTTFLIFAQAFKSLGRNLIKNDIIIAHNKNKKLFSEEFATTTNLIGSLLAVNIVSPIIRNKIGADVQKRFIKEQQKTNLIPQKTVFKGYSNSLKI